MEGIFQYLLLAALLGVLSSPVAHSKVVELVANSSTADGTTLAEYLVPGDTITLKCDVSEAGKTPAFLPTACWSSTVAGHTLLYDKAVTAADAKASSQTTNPGLTVPGWTITETALATAPAVDTAAVTHPLFISTALAGQSYSCICSRDSTDATKDILMVASVGPVPSDFAAVCDTKTECTDASCDCAKVKPTSGDGSSPDGGSGGSSSAPAMYSQLNSKAAVAVSVFAAAIWMVVS